MSDRKGSDEDQNAPPICDHIHCAQRYYEEDMIVSISPVEYVLGADPEKDKELLHHQGFSKPLKGAQLYVKIMSFENWFVLCFHLW